MPVNDLMPNATVIFTLNALFFWKQPRRFGKAMKKWRDAVFRKKTGKWECGTAETPSPPPPPTSPRSLTDLDYFHTFFSDIYKNEKQKQSSLGSLSLLSNDDGDGNEKGKKSNRFRLAKQQLCTLLHDHNVKVPIFTFCRDGDTRQQLSFLLFLNFDTVLQNSTPKTICHHLTN